MSRTSPESRFRLGRCRTGLGLFARVPLRAGARLIEYTGARITGEEADRRGGRYLFHVDATHAIDATGREHLARYINHACRPNCEARTVGRRIFIYARRHIEAGEELTYHYGAVYFRVFIKPMGCRCATCLRRTERVAIRTPAAKARLVQPPPAPRVAGSGRRAAPAGAGKAR